MDTAQDQTGKELREQLRVGVRMLEALQLQLNRGEEIIRREEEARRRTETTIESLESLERRVLEVMEAMPKVFNPNHPPTPDALRSGSLQVSSGNSLSLEDAGQFEEQLNKAESMRREFSKLVERAEAARSELDQSGTRMEANQLAQALHQLADELISSAKGARTPRTESRNDVMSLEKPVEIDLSAPAVPTSSTVDS